jgi:adenine C2-methylase RlmN of 23S rRNA A2503 and tRNA A37
MYSKILTSKIDHSANIPTSYKGLTIETRFVQRRPEYFIVYVSTHTGCVMKCKFCWLTQTGQTSFRHLDVESIT